MGVPQPLTFCLLPQSLDEALKYCNYVFTIVFVIEAVLKLVAFGFRRFLKDRWGTWGMRHAREVSMGRGD